MATQTSVSGSGSYCTAAQFVSHYDWRTAAQLLSDTDTPLPTTVSVQSNATLARLLKVASGKLESIALMGERYTSADLGALTGNAAEFLAWLVAALTVPLLQQRRMDVQAPDFPQREEAEEWLAALETGKAIFPTQEAQDAGRMDDQQEYAADVEARNLNTYISRRYFGRRGNRMDP